MTNQFDTTDTQRDAHGPGAATSGGRRSTEKGGLVRENGALVIPAIGWTDG